MFRRVTFFVADFVCGLSLEKVPTTKVKFLKAWRFLVLMEITLAAIIYKSER